jgi:hypothetical protein
VIIIHHCGIHPVIIPFATFVFALDEIRKQLFFRGGKPAGIHSQIESGFE